MNKLSGSNVSGVIENKISNYEELFQLWKDIPIIQKFSDNTLFKAVNHPIQTSILKILREGIMDKSGRKRNFLIANELLEHVNTELEGMEKSIKISMLYYHLEILQESKLITFVYFVDGRHKRKYFGRTAKFYLFEDENKTKEMTAKFFSPISKLILHYNPDADTKKYDEILEQIKLDQNKFSNSLVDWMRSNHEMLHELDIDALDLFSSMNTFIIGQTPFRKLFADLTPYMKFLE